MSGSGKRTVGLALDDDRAVGVVIEVVIQVLVAILAWREVAGAGGAPLAVLSEQLLVEGASYEGRARQVQLFTTTVGATTRAFILHVSLLLCLLAVAATSGGLVSDCEGVVVAFLEVAGAAVLGAHFAGVGDILSGAG